MAEMKNIWRLIVAGTLFFPAWGCSRNESASCKNTNDIEIVAEYGNLQSSESEISGSIYNKSLEKDYKNVQLRVDFYDRSGKSISSQVLRVDQKVGAGEAQDFEVSFNPPLGAEQAKWSVLCASEA